MRTTLLALPLVVTTLVTILELGLLAMSGACGGSGSEGPQDGVPEASPADAASRDANDAEDSPVADTTRRGSGVECHYPDPMMGYPDTCISRYYSNAGNCEMKTENSGPGPCPMANYSGGQGSLIGCCVMPGNAPGVANPFGPSGVCFYPGACYPNTSCIEDGGTNPREAVCEKGGAYGDIVVMGAWSTTPP
jgi:hypothetical protein